MWMDSSLRWGTHINEICEKSYKLLNILKVLAGSSWGVHPIHLRKLYISLIRSRIDYASFLYATGAKTHLNKLNIVQNKALRICGSFIKSTPIHVMETELALPPLFVRRHWLGYKFWLRVASVSNNQTMQSVVNLSSNNCNYWYSKTKPILIDVHNSLKEEDIHRSPLLDMYSLNSWVTSIDVKSCLCLNVKDVNNAKRNINGSVLKCLTTYMLKTDYEEFHKIYTDGSKDSRGVGAALFDSKFGKTMFWKLNKNICIMRAELIAITKALAYAVTLNIQKIVILTDSKSALHHLARCVSGTRGMPIAYEVLKLVCILQQRNVAVKLQWIPSHIGVPGNETVDQAAKQAIEDGTEIVCNPYANEFIGRIKSDCVTKWRNHFENCSGSKGIWYKTIQQMPSLIPWFQTTSLSRPYLVIAFRMRSGHVPLNKFYHLIGMKQSPNCMYCDKVEDLLHLLVECGRNCNLKQRILGDMPLYNGNVNVILSQPGSRNARRLYLWVKVSLTD
ncbi:uncharacterized protein LOC128200254 [Galleria mellonella]|uniref:ribonuclease H n=1 Tax=Galleria mellonella TaxID=7137 RepID=A0ABM3MCB4_GALME|nr:uncharacterized protein LOC128200254 [Galleria mellonella]